MINIKALIEFINQDGNATISRQEIKDFQKTQAKPSIFCEYFNSLNNDIPISVFSQTVQEIYTNNLQQGSTEDLSFKKTKYKNLYEKLCNKNIEVDTKDGIEKIFSSEKGFKLEFDTRYGNDYVYIKDSSNTILCCIRGKEGTDKYTGISWASNSSSDTKDSFIMTIIENLDEKEQEYIYNSPLFDISKPSDDRIRQIKEKSERDKFLGQFLDKKPEFTQYKSNGQQTIKAVNMRNYLTVSSTSENEYIGTMGLGPCIGLAIVSKKGDTPNKIMVAHIDALTNLESLNSVLYDIFSDANNIEITLISSENQREKAREILDTLTKNRLNNGSINISSDLSCSTNFAINTKTGEVSINVPNEDFQLDESLPLIGYMQPSDLHKSSHMK